MAVTSPLDWFVHAFASESRWCPPPIADLLPPHLTSTHPGWVEGNGLRGAPWTDEVMAEWVEAVVSELGGDGRGLLSGSQRVEAPTSEVKELQAAAVR